MHFAIVSYTFPPSNEIGGRRWAKFSQQLARAGHEVTVICTNNLVASEWYEKEYPGIDFKLLPKRYPDWLSGFTKSFIEKVYYFIFVRILSLLTKQNIFDRGFVWKKPMLHALEEVHKKKNIDVLVVTGAPFSLLYYGAEFKNLHKEIFYVADFRDPWTWGSYYGIPTLSVSKKKYQEMSEKITLEICDMVCFPTEHMGEFFKKKYPNCSLKLYLLPHAYDPEKFPQMPIEEERKGFIYGGTLYNGIEEYIKQLVKIVKENPNSGFRWDIYTRTNFPLIDSNSEQDFIKKHSFLPEEQLFQKIRKSAAYLAFFPKADKDLISTKFFEIIYTKTPILYIGEEGELGKFIRENRVGVHILPENMEQDLPKYLNGNVPFEEGYFDICQFTLASVVERFLKALNHHKNFGSSIRI
ncbi:MAG TPA: hypothetical protein VFL70_01060 [Bacteroidia bacterium]|nr:hypothetical protein [Bacteroidia bacterium]